MSPIIAIHVADWSWLGQVRSNLFIIIGRIREQDVNCLANLIVIYNTLEYNSDKKEYTSKQETAVIEGNLFGKSIPAPWCDTEICVKGDYFARHFGKEVTLCIDEYQAAAVDAHIDTLLIEQEAPNMNTTKSGYCAPATVQFRLSRIRRQRPV